MRSDGRVQLAAPRCGHGLQDHRAIGRQRCAGEHARAPASPERAGRRAAAARCPLQRNPDSALRVGRTSRRHGVRRDGARVPHSGALPARQISAAVRSARRLFEHRREHLGRDHFLGAARARRHQRAGGRGFSAAGCATGLRRLCNLRTGGNAGADPGPRCARVHAGSRCRRIHIDASEHDHSGAHPRVCSQCIQRALLGAASEALRLRMPGRQIRATRRGFQHALDCFAGSGGTSHPGARRPVHVSQGLQRSGTARAPAPAVRGQPDGDDRRTGERRSQYRPQRVLDVQPVALHQRIPLVLGSRFEVERIAHYHREYDEGADQPYTSPLFNTRSLFTHAAS